MHTRKQRPTSEVIATWRPSRWYRVAGAVGGALFGAPTLYFGLMAWFVAHDVVIAALSGAVGLFAWGLALAALRCSVTLHHDCVFVQHTLRSRAVPIEEVSALSDAGNVGPSLLWGEDRTDSLLAGPTSRLQVEKMRDAIIETRDSYLAEHDLTPRPDPELEHEHRVLLFERQGSIEPPPQRPKRIEYRKIT